MSYNYVRNPRATVYSPNKVRFQPSSSIKINLPVQEPKGVDIDEFIRNLNIELYAALDDKEQEECLMDLDAHDLFKKIKDLDNELAHVKLDLHIFTVFLQQHNPKLLEGLKQRRSASPYKSVATKRTSTATTSTRRTTTAADSIAFDVDGKRTPHGVYVSLSTKADIAERAAVETEKRIKQIQKKARLEMKKVKAEIRELSYCAEETDLTCKNFVLNFMADEGDIVFLETANEEKIIDKLKQFTNNWFKRARGLMATMRLSMSNLDEKCRQLRSDIVVKADLSTVLTSVDFDQLIIRRNQLLEDLEEIYKNMYGVKDQTYRALMLMGEEKSSMVDMDQKHKRMQNKLGVVIKYITKLERECKKYEHNNKRDAKVLEELEAKVERFHGPSLAEYVEQNCELTALEKEEKILMRKINIMNMTLANLNKQHPK